jgi:membrane protease subunit (stomatin/prohibitin family)
MPFRRRRPLLRAAAVGGGAYLAGKHMGRQQADQQDESDDQDQEQPAAATPQAAPTMADQVNQLADLHNQGVLSDDEFAAAKAKLFGT